MRSAVTHLLSHCALYRSDRRSSRCTLLLSEARCHFSHFRLSNRVFKPQRQSRTWQITRSYTGTFQNNTSGLRCERCPEQWFGYAYDDFAPGKLSPTPIAYVSTCYFKGHLDNHLYITLTHSSVPRTRWLLRNRSLVSLPGKCRSCASSMNGWRVLSAFKP